MSNYGRGNSYGRGSYHHNRSFNGTHRRNRFNNNLNGSNQMNDTNKAPFRILKRPPGEGANGDIGGPHTVSNNPSPNVLPNHPAPRFSNLTNPSNYNKGHRGANGGGGGMGRGNGVGRGAGGDNVAAVLHNVISEPNLGNRLLGMQRRGGRLFAYRRKDGKGTPIAIPQHHKKNYNKSIGRGKKFDKEREAALQAMTHPLGAGDVPAAAATTATSAASTDGTDDVIPIKSETNSNNNTNSNTNSNTNTNTNTNTITNNNNTNINTTNSNSDAISVVGDAKVVAAVTNAATSADTASVETVPVAKRTDSTTEKTTANTMKKEALLTSGTSVSGMNNLNLSDGQNGNRSPSRPTSPSEERRSWRRASNHAERGGRFGGRGRGRGRGRRGRGRGRRSNPYWRGGRHRSNYADGATWSDEEDYIRDTSRIGGNGRWSRGRSKFEPPRHRSHGWDKNQDKGSTPFGTAVMEHREYSSHRPHHSPNGSTLQSPNIGPRVHRHYNKKFNKLHRQLTNSNTAPRGGYSRGGYGRGRGRGRGRGGGPRMSSFGDRHVDRGHEDSSAMWDTQSVHSSTSANVDLENDVLGQFLNLQDGHRLFRAVPFLDVRRCSHVLGEIEEHLTNCQDFVVISVIGQQGVGKSTIMSALAGGENKVHRDIFMTQELSKLISSTHTTHGIEAFVSPERVIFLDCQPILSPSILLSLTNLRRRRLREKPHDVGACPLETWDIEMAKYALFLSSISHLILVVSDTLADTETINFVRSIYALRQSMKLGSFLRHDSSLRSKVRALQHRMAEKQDHKKSLELDMKMRDPLYRGNGPRGGQGHGHGMGMGMGQGGYRGVDGGVWRRQSNLLELNPLDNSLPMRSGRRQRKKRDVSEEEALFLGMDAAVEEEYKLYQLLNAQQRYGFPDLIFVQNKVAPFNMTPTSFDFERKFLSSMLRHQYAVGQGEVGNVDLVQMLREMDNEATLVIPSRFGDDVKEKENGHRAGSGGMGSGGSDGTVSEESSEEDMAALSERMNCFFIPRVESDGRAFDVAVMELKRQIMAMAKPQTMQQSHAYRQTERDWFALTKKVWRFVANAPNFRDYRGDQGQT